MAEPNGEQTRPLATSTHNRGDPENSSAAISRDLKSKSLRRRRCLQCCGCTTAVLLILAIIIVVLAFTVFKARDPTVRMDSVSIRSLSFSVNNVLRPSLNMTLAASLSVKNPNYVSFKFTNTTTVINYGGNTVGVARSPPGNAKARRTMKMNMTVDVIPEQIVTVNGLARDLLSGALTVTSVTEISGRVKIVGIKKHVDVRMECQITVNITSQQIDLLDCDRHVKL